MTARLFAFVALLLSLHTAIPAYAQESDAVSFEARVERVQPTECTDGGSGCANVTLRGLTDEFENQEIAVRTNSVESLGVSAPTYEPGDRVIVQSELIGDERQFFISDVVRRPALLWLATLFIAAVCAFGGLGAIRSFIGMIASFLVLIFFMIPRILAGDSPLLVALIGSAVIMIVTFILCHGWNKKTMAAFGGTALSLIATGILAFGFSVYARLTGTADEEMLFLLSDYPTLNSGGILLAGIIIGTLGVLDDITISQASAVFELRGANPRWSARELYRSACRIGADHIAAAVNTLVLAYAGTSLPLLLLLSAAPAGESWWMFINREMIATEIVRTLVGSIGLLAAVPLTTFIASQFAVRTHPHEHPEHEHAHGHRH